MRPDQDWGIACSSLEREHRVTGFGDRRTAIKHMCKHFLSEHERWVQLSDAPSPRELVRGLTAAGCSLTDHPRRCSRSSDCRPLVRSGAFAYVDTVRRSCDTVRNAAWIVNCKVELDDNLTVARSVSRRLAVVTSDGVFAVFAEESPSHMLTAYRPSVMSGTSPKRRHFVQAALRVLAKRTACVRPETAGDTMETVGDEDE